jgi:phosphoglycolate phosphatase-like HAD superfamily hydrolase
MKLFVIDIDGTITDSVKAHQSCFLKALGDVGIEKVDTDWGSYLHHTDSWIFGEVFRANFARDPEASEKNAFEEALAKNFDEHVAAAEIREIPGAVGFVNQIAAEDHIAYAFATGSLRSLAEAKLRSVRVQFPVELLVTASEFEAREDIITAAISAAKDYFDVTKFESIVSIGDGYWDLVAANRLNLGFIGIASGASGEKLRVAGAQYLYPDFSSNEIATKWCGRGNAAHI